MSALKKVGGKASVADPDPTSHFDADPDPAFDFDANPGCGSGFPK